MTYAMPPFTLHRPTTVAEALELARAHPESMYLAGGTDLVVNLRKRLYEPAHVIALRDVAELRGIAAEGEGLSIGALTTMRELHNDANVQAGYAILAEAAGIVAGPTIRNMATLGGNLCLDTRCAYYNQSHFWRQSNDFCLKKDGSVCHVAPGGSFCWATYSGDTGPVLLLLEAELELAGPEGARRVPAAQFYGADGRWSIGTEPGGKRPGELLVRVHLPPAAGWRGVYEKLRVRDSIDYPLLGVGLLARWANDGSGKLTGLRAALTAVNPRPELLPGLEQFEGQVFSPQLVAELRRIGNRVGKPMRTTLAKPEYRRAMVGELIERACWRLAPELVPQGESLPAGTAISAAG